MKKTFFQLAFGLAMTLSLSLASCDKNGNLNLLSVDEDKQLGAQVSAEIAANPTEYPLLPESNTVAYTKLRAIIDRVLNSGKLTYGDEFVWQVKIIQDDNTLNAFCTPGGYIYVYTGLIKYLDSEAQLAGVLGHEIAHADRRHTSRSMTQQYGYNFVVQAILGKDSSLITQIALNLKSLQNSRAHETEADAYSVTYLSATQYPCNGAAGFFEKLIASGQSGSTPAFLSTHPNPDNRVAAINAEADKQGCKNRTASSDDFTALRNALP